jgi:hypothetical protein
MQRGNNMNVLGIPLIKGNSNEVMGVKIDTAAGAFPMVEGMAGFWKTGSKRGIEPTLVSAQNPDSSGGFAGFIFDINKCAETASMLYEALLVSLPVTAGDTWTAGERITIDLATSLISKQGVTTNVDAYVDTFPSAGVNGKTGEAVEAVLVQILSNKQDFVPVVVAAAARASK